MRLVKTFHYTEQHPPSESTVRASCTVTVILSKHAREGYLRHSELIFFPQHSPQVVTFPSSESSLGPEGAHDTDIESTKTVVRINSAYMRTGYPNK